MNKRTETNQPNKQMSLAHESFHARTLATGTKYGNGEGEIWQLAEGADIELERAFGGAGTGRRLGLRGSGTSVATMVDVGSEEEDGEGEEGEDFGRAERSARRGRIALVAPTGGGGGGSGSGRRGSTARPRRVGRAGDGDADVGGDEEEHGGGVGAVPGRALSRLARGSGGGGSAGFFWFFLREREGRGVADNSNYG
ncbi:hypothetical protein T492DRAFT_842508 [Pavlovales sp. CCMP2436]|nr:hypothetical protein T492DRAFT_842508 [Pavlovales sp. CCMP2436]